MKDVIVFLGPDNQSVVENLQRLLGGEKNDTNDFEVWEFLGNPIEQLEAAKGRLMAEGAHLRKIVAFVEVDVLERRKELKNWFEAMAHFADVMLLINTKNVSPAWLRALKKGLKDRPMGVYDFPECLQKSSEAMREEILYPEARRLSQYFEEEALEDGAPIFEDEAETDAADDEEEEALPAEPFFARDAAGRRKIAIVAP